MQVAELDVAKFTRLLTDKYKRGDRWLAYDRSQPAEAYDLLFNTFKDIASAQQCCEGMNMNAGFDEAYRDYTIQPIINVLKSLSAVRKADSRIDAVKLNEQLSLYPISPLRKEDNLLEQLADGLYHPVKYHKEVQPDKDTESYLVIEHKYPEGMIYEIGHSSLKHPPVPTYQEAQKLFDSMIEHYNGRQFQPEIKMIGTIKGQQLNLDFEDHPETGTGIVFSVANPLEKRGQYQTQIINKPDSSIPIVLQKMAKFNRMNGTLEFFDGHLRKVAADAKVPFMPFSHLSTAPLELIKGSIAAGESHSYTHTENQDRSGIKRSGR